MEERRTACRLPEEKELVRVAAKVHHVVVEPPQSLALVGEAVIEEPGGAKSGRRGEARDAEAVVERDDKDRHVLRGMREVSVGCSSESETLER